MMPLDLIFWLAVASFAWGASLLTYRWFAMINGWPMGEWQAARPSLPMAIGMIAILFALLFAFARGGTTGLVVPLLGILLALAWTGLLRVGSQSALLLAPVATLLLIIAWISIALPGVDYPDGRTKRGQPMLIPTPSHTDPRVFRAESGHGRPSFQSIATRLG